MNTMPEVVLPSVLHHILKICTDFPDKNAIEDAQGVLTYAQLASRVEAVLIWLENTKLDQQGTIFVFLNNASDIAPVMLGLFNASFIYVPLDMSLPAQRLVDIANTVKPCAIIYALQYENQIKKSRWGESLKQVCVDSLWNCSNTFNEKPHSSLTPSLFTEKALLDKKIDTSLPCYLFFTSGTTATPKAIQGNLDGISHFILWQSDSFKFSKSLRLGRLTKSVYDASLRDFFLPLFCGGTIIDMPTSDTALHTKKMLMWLNSNYISILHMVPSLFRALLMDQPPIKHLKHIFLAGEIVYPLDVKKWFLSSNATVELINMFGPTETVMTKLFYRISKDDQNKKMIPIGQPITGVDLYFLSANKKVLPVGKVGEMAISLPFKNLGYWQLEHVQASVFRRDIVSDKLIYLTGDYARQGADGQIEFLGRKDRQVKVNGVRVELDSIENTLQTLDRIDGVFVDSLLNNDSNEIIVFYTAKQFIEPVIFQKHLQGKVAYLPHHYHLVDSFPRLLSGKVDRKLLKRWYENYLLLEQDDEFELPSFDVIERRFILIWQEKLQRINIHLDESFFELGGDSLQAIALIAEMEECFGVSFPFAGFLEKPTIRHCISLLLDSSSHKTGPVVCLNEKAGSKALWLIHPPGGFIFCYTDLAHHLSATHAVYALQYPLFNENQRFCNMDELTDYYLTHFLAHYNNEPIVLAGWSMGGLIAHALLVKLQEKGVHVEKLILLDTISPYRFPYEKTIILKNSIKSIMAYSAELFEVKDQPLQAKTLQLSPWAFMILCRLFMDVNLSRKQIFAQYSDEILLLGKIIDTLEFKKSSFIVWLAKTLSYLPRKVLIKAIFTVLYRLDKPLNDVPVEWFESFMNAFHDNIHSVCSYQPKAQSVPVYNMKAQNHYRLDDESILALEQLGDKKVQHYSVQGNHFTFLTASYVKDLVKRLREIGI